MSEKAECPCLNCVITRRINGLEAEIKALRAELFNVREHRDELFKLNAGLKVANDDLLRESRRLYHQLSAAVEVLGG